MTPTAMPIDTFPIPSSTQFSLGFDLFTLEVVETSPLPVLTGQYASRVVGVLAEQAAR
jgi:hypothetical protein